MATPDEWGRAYARQAQADVDTWDHLVGSSLPECQKLHFMQMACEKLAKAHLYKAGARPEGLQGSHGFRGENVRVGVLKVASDFQLSRRHESPLWKTNITSSEPRKKG